MIPHENNQWLRTVNARYITMPDVLKSLNVAKEDRWNLVLLMIMETQKS